MGDVIGVVEAAYAIDRDEYGWLRGILDRAAPFLDRGLGAFANSFDIDARTRIVTRATAFSGIGDEHQEVLVRTGLAIPPDQVEAFLRSCVATMSETWGASASRIDHQREPAANLRAQDFLGIVATNPVGHAVVLGAPLPEVTRVDAAFARRWARIAAHVAAAARMRQKLGAVIAPYTPELTRAALSVARARGPLRIEDPDAALEAWRPLVSGRWTLLDAVDDSGLVRLVARENAPGIPDAREAYSALGHPPDLVAYELGLDD